MTAQEVIAYLKLQPHPVEGGYFRETYRNAATLPKEVLPCNPGPAAGYSDLLSAHTADGFSIASFADG